MTGVQTCALPILILLLSGVHQSSLKAYHYAKTLAPELEVVHVEIDPEKTEKMRQSWEKWSDGDPLIVLPSPYLIRHHNFADRSDKVCEFEVVFT